MQNSLYTMGWRPLSVYDLPAAFISYRTRLNTDCGALLDSLITYPEFMNLEAARFRAI